MASSSPRSTINTYNTRLIYVCSATSTFGLSYEVVDIRIPRHSLSSVSDTRVIVDGLTESSSLQRGQALIDRKDATLHVIFRARATYDVTENVV